MSELPPSPQPDLFFDASSTSNSEIVENFDIATRTYLNDVPQPLIDVKIWNNFDLCVEAFLDLDNPKRKIRPTSSRPVTRMERSVSPKTIVPQSRPGSASDVSPNYSQSPPPEHVVIPVDHSAVQNLEDVFITMQSVTNMAEKILAKHKITSEFTREPASDFLGSPDITVLVGENDPNVVMVGSYASDLEFTSISNDKFFTETLNLLAHHPGILKSRGSSNLDQELKGIETVYRTYYYMKMNNLKYGYISTSSYTRFLKRVDSLDGYLEVSPAVTFYQSKPYNLTSCIVALAMQSEMDTPSNSMIFDNLNNTALLQNLQAHLTLKQFDIKSLNRFNFDPAESTYKLIPLTIPSPTTYNLGCASNTIEGHVKWWQFIQSKKKFCKVYFSHPGDDMLIPFLKRTNPKFPFTSASDLNDSSNTPFSLLPETWGITQGKLEVVESEMNPEDEEEYAELHRNEIIRGYRFYNTFTDKTVSTFSVVLKLCDFSSHNIASPKAAARWEKIQNEASLYEYFKSRHVQSVPALRVCGNINAFLRVLALEPCGRQITIADFQKDDDTSAMLEQKMKEALMELHAVNVLHRDVRLSNFVIDETSRGGRVRVINFGKARKYLRMYSPAKQEEYEILSDICLQCKVGILSPELV